MKTNISYHQVSNDEELKQILKLQKENLPKDLSKSEREREGFVTVNHSFKLLKKMNDKCPHIIVKFNNKVVGYALSMLQEFKQDIPVLIPMFYQIEKALIDIESDNLSYIVMGQICIDKNYRKQGLFRGLYNFMRLQLNTSFDVIITEVDANNTRSINAHKAVGFKLLKNYKSNNQSWDLIIWRWK